MVLREHFPQLSDWKVTFLSTDLSTQMLAKCQAGTFSQLEVNRGLPAPLLLKYFQKTGMKWQIKEDLRHMIEFRELNLAGYWAPLPQMDIIFLRNVLIYFDQETKGGVLGRIATVMVPDGYLYLGGAETVLGVSDKFAPISGMRGVYGQTAARAAASAVQPRRAVAAV